MGAWGMGILQNDMAQDNFLEVGELIERLLIEELKSDETATVGILAVGVGLLLEFSENSFSYNEDFYNWLKNKIGEFESQFDDLSVEAAAILRQVQQGQAKELVKRSGTLPAPLASALCGTGEGFPVEKQIGYRDPALFSDANGFLFIQKIANVLVEQCTASFADADQLSDFWREGECLGAFATLCLLEPCNIAAEQIKQWQVQFQTAIAKIIADGPIEENEQEFNQNIETALAYLLAKNS